MTFNKIQDEGLAEVYSYTLWVFSTIVREYVYYVFETQKRDFLRFLKWHLKTWKNVI